MKDDSSNNHAFKILSLMMKSFDQDEVKSLYFELRVPENNVPMPASTQTYIMNLMEFMARKNKQDLLISKLQNIRPHIDWPKSYTLPSEPGVFGTSQFHIESFVQEQHINIFPPALSSRKITKQKTKNDSLLKYTDELSQGVFKHTPQWAWFGIIISLLVIIGITILYFVLGHLIPSNSWFIFLIVFTITALILAELYRRIFSYIYIRIQKSTDFYSLSVAQRIKVKDCLQSKNWGNKFTDFLCRFLIEIMLETDKRQANKRRKPF